MPRYLQANILRVSSFLNHLLYLIANLFYKLFIIYWFARILLIYLLECGIAPKKILLTLILEAVSIVAHESE